MAPELVKVGRLKGEDFWTPIEDVVEERKARKTGKTPEPAAAASSSEAEPESAETTEDPKVERSILKHDELVGKWKDKPKKKDWQKANYQAVSTLL